MYFHTSITSALVAALLGLPAADSTWNDPRPLRRVELRIHEVKCLEETGIFDAGRDEISMSGLVINAAGRAARVRTLPVGKFARAGSKRTYSPPRVVGSFDLRNGPSFPNRYRTVLVLAERDNGGGLIPFVDAIVQKTNTGSAPTTSTPKGAALPNLTGDPKEMILDEAIKFARGKFDKWMKDDIFPPRRTNLDVKNPTFRFVNGSLNGPVQTDTLKAHRGKYTIKYSWHLVD